MDASFWSLLSAVLAALVGAALTHAFGRRSESIRALREARTAWATGALETRRVSVARAVDQAHGGARSDLPDEPALQRHVELDVLDPRGSEYAGLMVFVQMSVERWVARNWFGPGQLTSTIQPPQVVRHGRRMEHVLALWAQASWRMPIWRLRIESWWHVHHQQRWTFHVHGQLSSWRRWRQRRADAKSFREFDRKLRRDHREANRTNRAGLQTIRCSRCFRRAAHESSKQFREEGSAVLVVAFRCGRGHVTESRTELPGPGAAQ